MVLVEGESQNVVFTGIQQALSEPLTELRLFGKPEVSGKRRMGVALARADELESALEKAKRASSSVVAKLN
ncbi:hypothetical protein A3715_35985 [Oleiphilus sp. HI0009]|nr:hypothetical protein A3715_35985 [Oleiphilus sp. HI0009]